MFDFPFLIWRDEWLILPLVRAAVGKAARGAAWLLLAMAAAAVLELLLLYSGVWAGVLLGWFSNVCGLLAFVLSLLLLPWCLIVLSAGRGVYLSRAVSVSAALFGLLYLVCEVYTAVSGRLLLPQQGLLPLLLLVFTLSLLGVNWGRFAALSAWSRGRVIAAFVLYLCSLLGDTPETILLGVLFKIACSAAAFTPLRALADIAPRVVGLPPVEEEKKEDSPTQ